MFLRYPGAVVEQVPKSRAARPVGRRSQAERRAETRAKIVAAVVESIAEVGLARTTAVEIERRAGVTWGAVQHHFGGKDGLLFAVLEDNFARFAKGLEDLPVDAALEERARGFVDRSLEHLRGRGHTATFEILLNHLRREDHDAETDWRAVMFRAWDHEWQRLFGDTPAPRARQLRVQHYTISTLLGLASTLLLEGPRARLRPGETDLLVQTLVRELSSA